MSGLVDAVSRNAPKQSATGSTRKNGCSVSTDRAPVKCVIIDVDSVQAGGQKCDLLFVGEDGNNAWVSPIELKGGSFSGGDVARQLQGGADIADRWLLRVADFKLAPVLAHGKGVNKRELKALRSVKIRLRGQTRQTLLIRCGGRLQNALAKT